MAQSVYYHASVLIHVLIKQLKGKCYILTTQVWQENIPTNLDKEN